MNCPTCSHAMQTFGSIGNFWCPRCGSTAHDHPGNDSSAAPQLVERCRQFFPHLAGDPMLQRDWMRLGIGEAIGKEPRVSEERGRKVVDYAADRDVRLPLAVRRRQLAEFFKEYGPSARGRITEITGIPDGSLSAILKQPEFEQKVRGLWGLK
jgi:hypothetical protein